MKLPALMIAGLKEIFIYSLLKLQSLFLHRSENPGFSYSVDFFLMLLRAGKGSCSNI